MAKHRVFYGDPGDDFSEEPGGGPEEGDELCDGHQMHYLWKNGRWA